MAEAGAANDPRSSTSDPEGEFDASARVPNEIDDGIAAGCATPRAHKGSLCTARCTAGLMGGRTVFASEEVPKAARGGAIARAAESAASADAHAAVRAACIAAVS